jgi:DNA-directed RNA polymerase specialized sigma24 family protein
LDGFFSWKHTSTSESFDFSIENFEISEEANLKKTIKTINFDGSITEVEVSFDVWKADKEFSGKERYYKARTKSYLSFDELMRRNESFDSEKSIAELPAKLIEPSFENEIFANVENEILQKAISKLSKKQRRRIMFYYFENLTFEEIAKFESKKISARAIEYSVEAAVKNLKKILEKFKF